MISSQDVSFVVQGPIWRKATDDWPAERTESVLESIRHHFPDAEIILSTWANSDIQGLDFDQVVMSADPGSVPWDLERTTPNNVNRQIVSTMAGLRIATRTYAVKLRSDVAIKNRGFIDTFLRFQTLERRKEYSLFGNRIVIPTLFSRNPRFGHPLPLTYHPSDLFSFGHLPDLLKLWDIPLASEDQVLRKYEKQPKPLVYPAHVVCQYTPEQYIWLTSLRNAGKHVECEHFLDCRENVILESEKWIANNFIIDNEKQLGIEIPKRFGNNFPHTVYTKLDWLSLNKNNFNFRKHHEIHQKFNLGLRKLLHHYFIIRYGFGKIFRRFFRPVVRTLWSAFKRMRNSVLGS